MRVPRGHGADVAEVARGCEATDISVTAARDGTDELDIVTFNIGNSGLETVLGRLDDIPDPHITFDPRGVIALRPPPGKAASQVVDVEPRSPIEVYLSGLQSVGSWIAFLGYAAAAGVIVWIGLFTERTFLLVAAMLIAPFAGPAMNSALATARGDGELFRRSLIRYVAALAVTVATSLLLSLALGQQIATGLMVQESMVSSVAILLPLTAGAAGALNLCQSQRNSLVSGAATGMLIAASLAPPAGIVGMSIAIGEFAMIKSGLFLLLLQIAGINAAGAVIFRLYGVAPDGVRLKRGRSRLPAGLVAASVAILAALFAWQLLTAPNLQRSSTAQRAAQDARQVIDTSGVARVVKLDAQFTRANIEGQNTLLVTAYLQPAKGEGQSVKPQLEQKVRARLKAKYDLQPVTDFVLVSGGTGGEGQ